MRIAIYHNLPSGGAKRSLYEMTRRLVTNHIVDIFTLSCAEHNFCDLRPYVHHHQVYTFNPSKLFNRPFGRLNQLVRIFDLWRLQELQREIAQKIDDEKYDIVFVDPCRFNQSPAILRWLKTPSIYYCHEPPRLIYDPPISRPYLNKATRLKLFTDRLDPLPSLYRSYLRKLDRFNTLSATSLLVNSAFSRESFYRAYGVFADICYFGVDNQLFIRTPLPKGDFVFSVGSLTPPKGFDFLIQGLSFIEFNRRPRLVIASNYIDPEEFQYLMSLANQVQVSMDIRFMVSDIELVQLYNQALCTLYTPVMEPFGFVPLESMACGTVVIGVREGGIRETVIDNVTGRLVNRNLIDLVNTVDNVLRCPELSNPLISTGLDWVNSNWTWEKSTEKLEEYLKQCANLG